MLINFSLLRSAVSKSFFKGGRPFAWSTLPGFLSSPETELNACSVRSSHILHRALHFCDSTHTQQAHLPSDSSRSEKYKRNKTYRLVRTSASFPTAATNLYEHSARPFHNQMATYIFSASYASSQSTCYSSAQNPATINKRKHLS